MAIKSAIAKIKTEESSSGSDSEQVGNKTAALATCLKNKNRATHASSSSNTSKSATTSKRSESDSSEMERLHLSDTESESSGKKLPPKLKEEGLPRKDSVSKNLPDHKDRRNSDKSKSEMK